MDRPAPVHLQVTGSVLSSPARSRPASRSSSSTSATSLRWRRRSPAVTAATHPAAAASPATSVSSAQLEELRTLERERRAAQLSPPDSPISPQSAIRPGEFARALRRENFSHWPVVEPVSDAALLAEPRPGEVTERTVAIRPLIHPGPTNCSKNVVVRPRTAPAPALAEVPTAKPPLLARRPTTALARKVPEIEYALCWNLPPPPESAERPESGGSAASADSGVQSPRQAWLGPDSRQLTDRLQQLQRERPDSPPPPPPPGRLSVRESPEQAESGYGTPVARRSRRPVSADVSGGDCGGAVTAAAGEKRPATVCHPRSLSSPGSGGRRAGREERTERPPRGDQSPVERSELRRREKQTRFEESEVDQSGCEGRMTAQIGSEDEEINRLAGDPQNRRTPESSRASSVSRPASSDTVCTCRPVRAASAPDLRAVSTQTAGGGPKEPPGCRIDPARRLRVRPCRACELYRRQPRSVPAVRSDYRAALRAGCANWKPDQKPNVPQSRRPPRLAVRRPPPPPVHRVSTLTPPFAMWNDRRRDEYPARDRLQTTYDLMNRSALQPRRARSFQSLVYQ